MKVPRGTNSRPVRVRALRLLAASIKAIEAGDKLVHREPVTADNSIVRPGKFEALDLQTGRVRNGYELRARCLFPSGERAVSITPKFREVFYPFAQKTPRNEYLGLNNGTWVLVVKDVVCARVQDMTNDDALHEGINALELPSLANGWASTRVRFARQWNKRHRGRCAWENNPWVWVYRFERRAGSVADFLASNPQ